jgi:hypothetical protein
LPLKQEGAPVFSVNLTHTSRTAEPMTIKDGLAFQSDGRNVAMRNPSAGVPFAGCADDS